VARGRMVSKSLSTSKRRGRLLASCGAPCPTCGGSLAEFAEVLYLLLVAHADDFGRQEGDVFTIKHAVDPLTSRSVGDFTKALAALAEVGLIQWFSSNGSRATPVVSIADFEAHQVGLHHRTTSKFPEPPEDSGKFPDFPLEEKRREQNRTEEKKYAAAPRTSSAKKARPKVSLLAGMVLREGLLHLTTNQDELAEVVKTRAAQLGLPYDGRSVTSAIASATAQLKKRAQA